MNDSQCGFLRLPLELRHQIYEMCFDTVPEPSLLRVNSSVHDEAMHFLRKHQQTFSFTISGKGAAFDDFSQWCFRIKRHVPNLGRMRHLVLNIYPPDPDKPIEMWHIWKHVQSFCEDLAAQRRISQLTIKFIESDRARWATNGVAHTTMDLPYDDDDFCGDDVGQILQTLARFVDNVEKPRLILPHSYINSYSSEAKAQDWTDHIEDLMTGHWKDEGVINDYELLEYYIDLELPSIERATGRKSKAMFERTFGRVAILQYDDLENFKRQWTHMDDLPEWERPRWRSACKAYDCVCGKSYAEISMPDPAWGALDWERAQRWQKETLETEFDAMCPYLRARNYVSGRKNFMSA